MIGVFGVALGIHKGALAEQPKLPSDLGGREQNGIPVVDCLPTLRLLDPAVQRDRAPVFVCGFHAAGDGSTGLFWFDDSCTLPDDGGRVIRPDRVAQGSPGRWRRA